MSDMRFLQDIGVDNGMNEGQNHNLTRVMAAQYLPTDKMRQEIVSKKLGNPQMFDYKGDDGFGRNYLMGSFFVQKENHKQFSTPETTYSYLQSVTNGKDALFAPNQEQLKRADSFVTEIASNEKDPSVVNKKMQAILGVAADGQVGSITKKAVANYISVFGEDKLKKQLTKTEAVADTAKQTKIINALYEEFGVSEGNGDTTGAAPTGSRGLTTALYAEMKGKHGASITEEQASKFYLTEIYTSFSKNLEGFTALDEDVQKGVLDSAYNLGYKGMLKYKGFAAAIKANDKEAIFKNLLDTATVAGQSYRGLAKRRAHAYNEIVKDSKITSVKQEEDGTLKYMKGEEVFFSYKAPKGRAAKSSVGTLKI